MNFELIRPKPNELGVEGLGSPASYMGRAQNPLTMSFHKGSGLNPLNRTNPKQPKPGPSSEHTRPETLRLTVFTILPFA